jgi:anti-anti-sigma factor
MEPCRFSLRGEIDAATADELIATLRSVADREPDAVVVDCMELTFIDAAGIGALVVVHRELAQQHRDLRVVHPSRLLVRMLRVLDLTYLLGSSPVPARASAGRS